MSTSNRREPHDSAIWSEGVVMLVVDFCIAIIANRDVHIHLNVHNRCSILVKISNFYVKNSKNRQIEGRFFYRPFHQFWRKISVQNLLEQLVHSRKWALDLEKAGFECQVISADVQSGKSTSRICYPKQVKVVSGNRNWNHEFIG